MANRRDILAAGAAALASPVLARGRSADRAVELVVGGYGAPPAGGLRRVGYRPASDAWTIGAPIGAIANASFGVHGTRLGLHYLLDEVAGSVGVYRPGGWARLASVASGGEGPCHAALDAEQSWLAIAHYGDGTVALHRLDERSGLPIGPPTLRRNAGRGGDRGRQAGPHAHWVGFSPDGRWLHSIDFGTDELRAFAFDRATGTLGEGVTAWRAPAGSGPRHLVHHPRRARAYVVHELANTLTTLDRLPGGRFAGGATLSTLPAGFGGASFAAHIAMNRAATRLYVSNRGANSLAIFALDPAGGAALLRHVAVPGDWPRCFLLVERERRLIVANQRSGDLVVFAMTADGDIAPTGRRLSAPGAAYLATIG